MFEKEAQKWVKAHTKIENKESYVELKGPSAIESFEAGAEFGYNKANENDCELLKSLLYCTVKSCNNCGKVNCENFQRQRIDYCGLWVSYKDYIAKLEKENAVLKKKNSDEECLKRLAKKGYIKLCSKANEWHFVKDGKYPAHSNRVLVFTDEGVGFGIYGLDNQKWYTYDTGFDVIAWKEIELPKEGE